MPNPQSPVPAATEPGSKAPLRVIAGVAFVAILGGATIYVSRRLSRRS